METALLDNPEVKQAQQAAIATDPRTALPSSQREQQ
jgi:hypothetical protein